MAGEGVASVKLTEESRATLKKLATIDITPEMRKQLRAATGPMQAAVRKAARSLPATRTRKTAKGTAGGSLRNALAMAVMRKVKNYKGHVVGLVTVVPRGGKSNIARAVEGEIPWEHGVFKTGVRVRQSPMPFFYKTVEAELPHATAEIEKILDDIGKKL